MQEKFGNIEYLRVLGMLPGDSKGQFHITSVSGAAVEIGNIVYRNPARRTGTQGEI